MVEQDEGKWFRVDKKDDFEPATSQMQIIRSICCVCALVREFHFTAIIRVHSIQLKLIRRKMEKIELELCV